MGTKAEGYRKIKATELPKEQQEKLRSSLQYDLADALIKAAYEGDFHCFKTKRSNLNR